MTVIGGAGSFADFKEVISQHGIVGVSAGSIFVFKEKFRAVLISYPTHVEKENLIDESLKNF